MATRYSVNRKGAGGRPKGEPTAVVRLPVAIAAIARRMASRQNQTVEIAAFLDVDGRGRAAVPFAMSRAACGFPSPADDYLETPLDFNELLIANPAATFAVKLASDSMVGAGLFPGDIAIIDRSVTPRSGVIVLALVEGEFTVKRYFPGDGTVTLKAENAAFADITVTGEQAFEIWGVVTKSIRML